MSAFFLLVLSADINPRFYRGNKNGFSNNKTGERNASRNEGCKFDDVEIENMQRIIEEMLTDIYESMNNKYNNG